MRTRAHTHTHTHTRNGVLLIHKKKNETLPFAATWMNLEAVILSEKSENNFTYLWNLNNKANEQIKLKHMNTGNRLEVSEGKGGR